jgi:hypothetical protein
MAAEIEVIVSPFTGRSPSYGCTWSIYSISDI